MRLKIPLPVQTWFNTLSISTNRRSTTDETEIGTVDDMATSAATAIPAVSTPFIVEALQDLCYEIFALPVCTGDAVNIAQTICGHIYESAQSTDPALQLLVLDLLPTLLHVYLVLSTTLSGGFTNFKADHRRSDLNNDLKHSIVSKQVEATAVTSVAAETSFPSPKRIRKSLRERLKKSSSASAEALRRPNLNKTMRQRTHRLFKGLGPEPNNTSNTSSMANEAVTLSVDSSSTTLSVVTAKSNTPTSNSQISAVSNLPSKHLAAVGIHMTSLAAVLEALLLGLYNTFTRSRAEPSVYSALPSLANGSVFCGPLNTKERKEEQDGESLEELLQIFSKKDPENLLIGEMKDAKSPKSNSGEETELTACNRWRILRLLCRLCTERIGDLTERGRSALCYLGLLLGPHGLREYRLPPTPDSLGNVGTLPHYGEHDSSHQHGHRPRWRRFGRQHHHHRRHQSKPKASPPMQESIAKYGGGQIDLTRTIAPLRFDTDRQREKLSVGSKFKSLPKVNAIGLDGAATVAVATRSEEPEGSRVNDDPLDVANSEKAHSDISAASRSPTISTPHATSSCASSDVSSISDEISSTVSSNEEVEEDDLCNAFGALNKVEEDREDVEDTEGEEPSQHPTNGNSGQNGNNELYSFENSKPDTDGTFKNALSMLDQCDAMPEYELSIENNLDENVVSARSTFDTSLTSLNETSSFFYEKQPPPQQQVNMKSRKPQTSQKNGEEREYKKLKRRHFHLRSSGGRSEGTCGVTVASARIPQLPSHFVIELLPSLHFILSTVQSHLAASAIKALVQRANLELWPNVLLYTNGICNSKLYYDVAPLLTGTVSSQINQINHSNLTSRKRVLSPAGSAVSSCSSHASLTLIHDDEEKAVENTTVIESSASNRSHKKAPITNASFQAVRPEEDIPLVMENAAERASLVALVDTKRRARSLSPRRGTTYSAADSSRGLLGLTCEDLCGTGKTFQYHWTLSFNPRLCSALRSSRLRSPTNLKVTFVDESFADGKGDRVDSNPPPPPPHSI